LAERADVGVGARLDELDGVGQQGFSFPQCLRIPAGRQQVKTPGEMPGHHVQNRWFWRRAGYASERSMPSPALRSDHSQ
jgi:hypothetical protein